jgi:hypothetical protein
MLDQRARCHPAGHRPRDSQPLEQAAAYTGAILTRAYMTFQLELLAAALAAVRPTHRIGFAPRVLDGRVHGIEVRLSMGSPTAGSRIEKE